MACDKALEDAKMYYLGKGKDIGKKEGIEEGIKEGKIEAIKNLMNSLQITIENALELLCIPQEERNMYIAMINGTN